MQADVMELNYRAGKRLMLSTAAAFALAMFAPGSSDGLSVVNGSGRVTGTLSLSAGEQPTMLSTTVTGATVSHGAGARGELAEMIDFGDLSRGTGEPVTATVYMRLRGNAPYKLNIAVASFSASDLQVRGKDVSGTSDRGSFVRLQVGEPRGGGRANLGGSRLDSGLRSGVMLDQLVPGPLSAESSSVSQGDAPSLGGTSESADNGIDIPISFSVPTGLEIGPVPGKAYASFQVTVQLGVFARR